MDLIICTKLELENRNKNLILSINILDLEKQSSNNIIEAGLIKYRDCEFLRAFISEEGINEEFEKSKAFISETKEKIEEEGDIPMI